MDSKSLEATLLHLIVRWKSLTGQMEFQCAMEMEGRNPGLRCITAYRIRRDPVRMEIVQFLVGSPTRASSNRFLPLLEPTPNMETG